MAREFKLPDLGEGIHEGEIVEIFVTPGDAIQEGDPLMEVETDKAVTAIPSPHTGTVTDVNVRAGDTVHVGDILVIFDSAEAVSGKAEVKSAKKPPETVKDNKENRKTEEPEKKAVPEATYTGQRKRPPVPASPATRRLARELEVDLYDVDSTGPAGLVTAEDVQRHAEGIPRKTAAGPPVLAAADVDFQVLSPSPALPDFEKWGPVETEPLKSVRRATARQMALSWSQIPHVANQNLVDVTELEALRKRHAADVEQAGGKLTLTVFMLKAVTAGLKQFPRFNASIDMAGEKIIYKHYYHIGIAMDTGRGLIVPVIRDVDRKSITELAVELDALVNQTREGKTDLEALQGGTFTITNAGAVGGGFFAPIINYPQAAILGMGRARLQPAVRTDAEGGSVVVPRLLMPLVVSFDHRVADGADAIRFMQVIMDCLEDPEKLLVSMS